MAGCELTGERPAIPALTGIRFYAAFLVVVTHFSNMHLAKAGYAWAPNMTVLGSLGMTMFFVLSGFVIQYNYGDGFASGRPGELYRFAVARFARLYPLFIFATALNVASAPSVQAYQWKALPYWLTMTQGWLPIYIDGRFPGDALTPGSWSVSVEVLLYIVFVPLAVGLGRAATSDRLILRMAIAMTLLLFAVHGVRAVTGLGGEPGWLWYRSAAARLPEFVAGMLAAAIFMRRSQIAPPDAFERLIVCLLLLGSLAIIVALLAGHLVRPLPVWADVMAQNWFAAPFFAIGIYALARFELRSPALDGAVVLALGEASYSIYLLHPPILWMLAWQGTEAGAAFIVFKALVSLAAVFLFSLGVYRYLESPARRFIRSTLIARRAG